MKKINFISATVALLCVTTFARAQDVSINEKFDALLKEAYSKQVFSGNVLVAKNGNIIYQKSIGNADYNKNISNDADTKFQIGSISKFFTKTIILQLQEEGKVDPSDKLGKYLFGFSNTVASKVGIQQLMDHTSGLGDYTEEQDFMQVKDQIKIIIDILPLIQKQTLEFTPGSKTLYSNSGYVVLAAIIEKITGKSYGEVLQQRIFEKIGMHQSGFNVFVKAETGKANGYLSNQLGTKQDNLSMHVVGGGDGGIFTSTGDLWKFVQSLLNDNKLLSDSSKLRLVNTPLFPVHYTAWHEFKEKGKMAIAGGAPGISALLAINMEKQYCFVVLSNYDERTAEDVGQCISAVLNDKEPAPFHLPPSRFIYELIKNKGASYFVDHYKTELSDAGIALDNDMILLFAGEQFLQEKDAEHAIALYKVYTKEFPDIVVAWNDMGDAYLLTGDKPNARKCFEQALKIRPANQRAKEALQQIH
ncbi:MAG: serine hydrolase [Panacibacter sp.]